MRMPSRRADFGSSPFRSRCMRPSNPLPYLTYLNSHMHMQKKKKPRFPCQSRFAASVSHASAASHAQPAVVSLNHPSERHIHQTKSDKHANRTISSSLKPHKQVTLDLQYPPPEKPKTLASLSASMPHATPTSLCRPFKALQLSAGRTGHFHAVESGFVRSAGLVPNRLVLHTGTDTHMSTLSKQLILSAWVAYCL
ncbi:hypothetical protein HDV57DRAFT_8036 [Trichoderma longibrachiatum]|uniref:Uncharacterized protein n=1 Tax=Trichoderma longibrachiatum ATCC 18648 TaxID=983965 RepID=A0A2T4CJL1_TRILO|nr:hypothetical protein M440DRAFT_1022675 [Trichoderma longibrachiatum ATCC 18648]